MRSIWLYSVSWLVFIALCVVALTGFSCRRNTGTDTLAPKLVVWGLWQESADMDPVMDAFNEQYGVEVEYKKVASVANYEQDLLEALAEGRGPDIFVIHHTWVDDKRLLLNPAPVEIVDERALRDEFVDVVAHDVLRNGQVYALPTSVDTLAMYYNKDILNAAGVARPPRTWTDYQQMVERLTKVNRLGVIQQSGGALGTAANVNRAADIFQLLLMQSGLPIVDEGSERGVDIANETGERSLVFYTDFANKAKQVYTWNLQQDFSIDAFAEGETATMFNYSYHLPTIRAKNTRMNFGVAAMPQIAGSSEASQLNFAAYWPWTVSTSSASPATAWQLVRFMTSRNASQVINNSQQVPPARRDSIAEVQRDPDLGVFAEQALTADSWPRRDITATDTIFNAMIDNVVIGSTTVTDALRQAEDQLNKLRENND